MERRIIFGIVLTLVLISMLSFTFNIQPIKAAAKTIYVDDDNTTGPWDGTSEHPYRNITSGVEHAALDDTVFVFSGTYYESVNVDKTLLLVGEDNVATIVDANGTALGVDVNANEVTVSGFTVMNCIVAGIRIVDSDSCVISTNRVLHSYLGIAVVGNNNTVSGNYVEDTIFAGIRTSGTRNTISENNVTQCLSQGNGDAIQLTGTSSAYPDKVLNNKITQTEGFALHVWATNNTIVSGNEISNTESGIYVQGTEGAGAIVMNNTVWNLTDTGMYLYAAHGITIINNNVTDCRYAIWANTWGCYIYHNAFDGEESDAVVTNSNYWHNGYPSGGNHWGHYSGIDFYRGPDQNEPGSDGIGDTPYVFGSYSDKYPLMEPYMGDHDLVISYLYPSKTVVGKGFSLNFTCQVSNFGIFPEDCNVTLFANATIVASTNFTLTARNSRTIIFTWNTTVFTKGKYITNAAVDVILGEKNIANNNFTDGWIIVSMIGDITGPDGWPDGKCDIRDLGMVAILYGVNYPDTRYDPNCDLTGPTTGVADGKIDIRDLALVAIHYGEIDP